MLKSIFDYFKRILFTIPLILIVLVVSTVILWFMNVICCGDWWTKLIYGKFGTWSHQPANKV